MAAPTTTPRRGSVTVGPRTLLRRVLTSPLTMVTVMLVTALVALLLAGLPRLVESVSDEGLRRALDGTQPSGRNIEASLRVEPEPFPSPDPLADARAIGAEFADRLPESVTSITTMTSMVLETKQFRLLPLPGDSSAPGGGGDLTITLRYIDGLEERVRMVEGDWPGEGSRLLMWQGEVCPTTPPGPEAETIFDSGRVVCRPVEIPVVDVVFSRETVEVLGVGVGDRLMFEHPVFDPFAFAQFPIAIEVSGVIEVVDPDDEFWFGDPRLATPYEYHEMDLPPQIGVTGLFGIHDYVNLDGAHWQQDDHWTYRWRHFVDHDRMTVATAPVLASDLRRVLSTSGDFEVSTRLVTILDSVLRQREVAIASVSMSLVGVLAVAWGLIWMLAALIGVREGTDIVLMRSRGGSGRQMTMSQLLLGIALTTPAVVVGYLLATFLTDGQSNLSFYLIGALAVAAPLAFLVATRRETHADLGTLQRRSSAPHRSSLRSVVVEIAVILACAGALLVLWRRAPETGSGVDLLAAVAPTLFAVGAGLILLRFAVIPIALGAWAGRRTKGSVGFVGFRRLGEQLRLVRLPVLVILTAVAVALFSFMVRQSTYESEMHRTYMAIGADHRVTGLLPGHLLDSNFDPLTIPGVEAVAKGYIWERASSNMPGESAISTHRLLVVDTAEYQQVLAGTPVDPGLGDLLPGDMAVRVGSSDNPIPVIVSTVPIAGVPPTPGMIFSLRLGVHAPSLVVAEVRETFPGFDAGVGFVVVEAGAIEAARVTVISGVNVAFVRGGAAEEVAEYVRGQGYRIESQNTLFGDSRDNPFASAVDLGLLLAVPTLLGMAVIAAISYINLTETSRTRDMGYLRTMGLSYRQNTRIKWIEVVTPVAFAGLAGSAVGIASTYLLREVVGLHAVASVGWLAAAIAVLVVSVAAFVVSTLLSRQSRSRELSLLVKIGDE